MTNKELVVAVLKEHSCLTANEVRQFAIKYFNMPITPQAVSGAMRPLIATGLAGSDKHPSNGKTVYWLNKEN